LVKKYKTVRLKIKIAHKSKLLKLCHQIFRQPRIQTVATPWPLVIALDICRVVKTMEKLPFLFCF
jgi:hypothetical protein